VDFSIKNLPLFRIRGIEVGTAPDRRDQKGRRFDESGAREEERREVVLRRRRRRSEGVGGQGVLVTAVGERQQVHFQA